MHQSLYLLITLALCFVFVLAYLLVINNQVSSFRAVVLAPCASSSSTGAESLDCVKASSATSSNMVASSNPNAKPMSFGSTFAASAIAACTAEVSHSHGDH